MKLSDTVFLTTIFPVSEEYLNVFFSSLQKQTTKKFDVLVVNDGITNFALYKEKYFNLNILEIISKKSPAKNRQIGIKKCVELGYKNIIFGDSDDYFSDNRIYESIRSLENNDIAINELNIFYHNNKINDFFLKHLKNTNSLDDNFLVSNVFGFSNISIRTEIIPSIVDIDNELIAVDWFFMTTIFLQKKYRIKFLKDVKTYYRQYSYNTIGLSLKLTEQKLNLGLKVKREHYSSLINYCKKNNLSKYYITFNDKLSEINDLNTKLIDPSFKKRYIEIVNLNIEKIFTGWWSEIITIKEYNRYENSN